MSSPLVSLVVPVYNVERYVTRCVTSLTQQTYRHLEIILVDDGSTDGSTVICDTLAASDPRIHVIHKSNGGLSDARNVGIRKAHGEYIGFIDGDDYVHPDFVSELLATLLVNNADISACGYYKTYEDGSCVNVANDKLPGVFTNLEAIRDILTPNTRCEVMAWNKLYRRELFRVGAIRYPVGKLHEDIFTTYKLFYNSKCIAYTSTPLYYYVQRQSSIIGVGFNKSSVAMIEGADEITEWVRENKVPLEEEARAFRASVSLHLLSLMVQGANIDRAILSDLKAWISTNRASLLFHNKHIATEQKAIICLLAFGMRPYLLLRRVLTAIQSI